MSKKHFIAAAQCISQYVSEGKISEAKAAAVVFSTVAKADNPKFDILKFKEACNLVEK